MKLEECLSLTRLIDDAYDTCYWSIIEVNVAICCVCMPNLRLLLIRVSPRLAGSSARRLTDQQDYEGASRRTQPKSTIPAYRVTSQAVSPAYLNEGFSKTSVDRSSTTELVDMRLGDRSGPA